MFAVRMLHAARGWKHLSTAVVNGVVFISCCVADDQYQRVGVHMLELIVVLVLLAFTVRCSVSVNVSCSDATKVETFRDSKLLCPFFSLLHH